MGNLCEKSISQLRRVRKTTRNKLWQPLEKPKHSTQRYSRDAKTPLYLHGPMFQTNTRPHWIDRKHQGDRRSRKTLANKHREKTTSVRAKTPKKQTLIMQHGDEGHGDREGAAAVEGSFSLFFSIAFLSFPASVYAQMIFTSSEGGIAVKQWRWSFWFFFTTVFSLSFFTWLFFTFRRQKNERFFFWASTAAEHNNRQTFNRQVWKAWKGTKGNRYTTHIVTSTAAHRNSKKKKNFTINGRNERTRQKKKRMYRPNNSGIHKRCHVNTW